jgi:hypothetical protein
MARVKIPKAATGCLKICASEIYLLNHRSGRRLNMKSKGMISVDNI